MVCLVLLALRLAKQDYGIAIGEANKENLKPALASFYYVSLVQGAVGISFMYIEMAGDTACVYTVSRQNCLSPELLRAYLDETKQMCVNNPTSTLSWNLIAYGAGLLDSQSPEDYASGGRVLTMLIDHDIPLLIRQLLIRSPRQRILKLIGTLAWRSPEEQEMRWLAARIVEHLACDLSLAHFPGALECISSLFDTSSHNSGYQEAIHLTSTVDLVLPGLRILENLAHDSYNCTLIYNTKVLLSKIVAPIKSNNLVENIRSNVAWTKVVDGSLKVVSKLMGSSGSTSEEMCGLIADDSNVVKNLDAVLDLDMKSNSGIIELHMRVLEVLTQLASHHLASTSAQKLIERALHIFVTTDWMEDYLKDEKSKMKEAKETASLLKEKDEKRKMKEAMETACLLKEKAGEALAILSSDSEARKSFARCKDDNVCRLTELLDSKIKTIKCKLSATDTMEIEISVACRISATVILKHFSNHDKERTLRKVLAELLPVQGEGSSTPQCWECLLPICCRNDIENQMNGRQDEPSASESHNIQQCGERRLQAELISLVAVIRANNNLDFAAVLASLPQPITLEDFVVRLKKMVEDNMYATPACLVIHKLTCEMVIEFIQHDLNVRMIDKHNIVGTLLKASKIMTGLESSMLFTGVDYDCCGVPVTPLSSVLAKNAEDLLTRRKHDLGINIAPAGVSPP